MMKRLFLGLLLALPSLATAQSTTTTYLADNTTVLPNPERGFSMDRLAYKSSEALNLNDLQGIRAGGVSLVRRVYILQDFRSADISPAYLDMVAADFRTARAAGLKLVVRFAYNWNEGPDAPKARILSHISQLKNVLQTNADVIAFVEAGFIGRWGEWHDSTNGLDNTTDRGDILKALLGAVPASRMVAVRYPNHKKQIFNNYNALTPAEAFTQTDRARVGGHNDYFLSDEADGGTYTYGNATEREKERSFLSQDNRYVVQGGESGANNSTLSSCSKSVAELKRLRYSQLNAYWHDGVLARWQTEGCMDEIKRKLGHRYRLIEATAPGSVAAGATFTTSLKVRNDGWASCYNARGLEVILRNKATGGKLVVSGGALSGSRDPRFWLTDEEHTVSVSYTVPAGTPTGQYELLLNLPDPTSSLHDRPEYAIRLANQNTWESATGYNKLGREVTVTAGTATPSPTPAPTSFSGTYTLTARHSGRVLDVSGVSTADGATVHQWDDKGGTNQQWQVQAVGTEGYYTLTARHSGKKLTLDLNSATNGGYTDATANGVHVFQFGTDNSDNRLWKIEATADGYYKLTNKRSGKVLAVSGGPSATGNGAPVHQWVYGGGTDQQWKLALVAAASASSLAASPVSTQTSLSTYPNPSPDGRSTLELHARQAQRVTVYVHNQQGRLVRQLTVPVQAGRTDYRLSADLQNTLPEGIYFLRATIDGQKQQFTLKVQ